MKVNLQELRAMVNSAVNEAKKKKEKAEKTEKVPAPPEYRFAEELDFSAPLGAYNLYKSQGAVNWGPMTGPGPSIDDRLHVPKSAKMVEALTALSKVIPEASAWGPFLTEIRKADKAASGNIWESIMHWYDFQKLGLGKVREAAGPKGKEKEGDLDEKKLGFKKLKNKLSHQKGVKDPSALAASIGTKKYGKAGMAKKSAAGRK